MLALAGCSKSDNSNLEHLLGTVPNDASAVIVADVPSLLQDAGCKVEKDGAIQLSDELASAMKSNRDLAGISKAMEKGELGLMAAPIIYFEEGDIFYLTGLLADPEKFMQFASEQEGQEFADEQGVKLCGYYAVKGNQFWYSRSSLGSKEINRFTGLDNKRSFLANEACPKILDDDSDIRGLFDLNVLIGKFVAPQQRPMASVGVATLFKDAEYAYLEADFEKGEFESEVKVLDSKLNAAKFLLPSPKVSEKTVLSLGETADAVFAINVSKKLVETIMEKAQAFVPAQVGTMLAPVDGTTAMAFSKGTEEGYIAVVNTDGTNSSALVQELSRGGVNVATEGNTLVARQGKVSGQLLVKDAADKLDDAFAGFVASGSEFLVGGAAAATPAKGIRQTSYLLIPDDGSLKLDVEIKFENTKENALIQLLQVIK